MHQVRAGQWHVANTHELTEAFTAGTAMPVKVLATGPFDPHPGANSVRIIHLEQHITPTLSSRDRPLITASNGPLMARVISGWPAVILGASRDH